MKTTDPLIHKPQQSPTPIATPQIMESPSVAEQAWQSQQPPGLSPSARDAPVAPVAGEARLWTPLGAVIQRARTQPQTLTRADVLQLHRAIGNRAVERLLQTAQARQAPQRQEEPQTPSRPPQAAPEPPQATPLAPSVADAASLNAIALPDRLKASVETLSGMSLDDVRVHYNSAQPQKVGALAYAQGSDIHVAPGQERHLGHEAWHIVQQKQGRVRPTMQAKGVAINDDENLEREADAMNLKALRLNADTKPDNLNRFSRSTIFSATKSMIFASKSCYQNKYYPVQLKIAPNFGAWQVNKALTKGLIEEFYHDYVRRELRRASEFCTDDIVLQNIKNSYNNYKENFRNIQTPGDLASIQSTALALDTLIFHINEGLDDVDQAILESMSIPGKKNAVNNPNAGLAEQNRLRLRRKLRAHTKIRLGEAHENEVRGFESLAEGLEILQNALDILRQNGINDGHVAIRGSAVRGRNRDYTRPYRPGTDEEDNTNDSSDIDLFFTSQTLERALARLVNRGEHIYEGGGNVHPDTLREMLEGSKLHLPGIDQPAIADAITRFSTRTKDRLGRKADITLIKTEEIKKFEKNEYILI